MIKSYKLEELDCANCASKMEHDISQIPGVEKANITFMTSRMKIDFSDGANIDQILDEAQGIIHKYEDQCNIIRR